MGQNNDNQQNNHKRIYQQQSNQNEQGQENETDRVKLQQKQNKAQNNQKGLEQESKVDN